MGLDDFASNAGQLFDELSALELMTPDALNQAIRGNDARTMVDISNHEYDRLKAYLKDHQPDLLDDGSSDVLLAGLLKSWYERILEHHPMGRGRGRPNRLAQIAAAYRRMVQT